MVTDPFESLRNTPVPRRPDPRFAALLARRLERELHMDDGQLATVPRVAIPAMVHLGVDDADRSAAFFASVFDWETERVEYRGHVRHYVLNTGAVTPCITDEPGAPPVQLGFTTDDVNATARVVEALGGRVVQDDAQPDGGGSIVVHDDQDVPLQFWRAGDPHPHDEPARPADGDLGYFCIRVPDVERATAFYGAVLGWPFERGDGDDEQYQHVANHVGPIAMGILGGVDAPSVALHFIVADLDLTALRVREAGGSSGERYQTGPLRAIDCRDDRDLEFSIAVLHR